MNVVLTWLFCLVGQMIHLAVQIDAIVRAKNNTATSHKSVLRDRAIPIIARLFAATMFFGVFFGGGLPELLKALNMDAPAWTVTIAVLLSNTGFVGICLSGLIGLGLDSMIGFFPFFKPYLPPPIDQLAQAQENKGFVKGVEAAKDAVDHVEPPPANGGD